jgi:hypothetical protein
MAFLCPVCRNEIATAVCGVTLFYCSEKCQAKGESAFCEKCMEQTVPIPADELITINSIGFRLYGKKNKCSNCGAVERQIFFCAFFVPLIPIPKRHYKVIHLGRGWFLSRRIGDYKYSDASFLLNLAARQEDNSMRAIQAYQKIIQLFPNTRAAKEATNTIELMRKNLAKN